MLMESVRMDKYMEEREGNAEAAKGKATLAFPALCSTIEREYSSRMHAHPQIRVSTHTHTNTHTRTHTHTRTRGFMILARALMIQGEGVLQRVLRNGEQEGGGRPGEQDGVNMKRLLQEHCHAAGDSQQTKS